MIVGLSTPGRLASTLAVANASEHASLKIIKFVFCHDEKEGGEMILWILVWWLLFWGKNTSHTRYYSKLDFLFIYFLFFSFKYTAVIPCMFAKPVKYVPYQHFV